MKTIKIKAISNDDFDFGLQLSVDGKTLTKHLEADTAKAMEKLLVAFNIKREDFEIIDER